MTCVAAYCSALQCVTVCCSVYIRDLISQEPHIPLFVCHMTHSNHLCCSVLQCVAVRYSVLQCIYQGPHITKALHPTICVWHDSFEWPHIFSCHMTHSRVTCLIHVWLDLFTCDMTHSRVTWLIHVWLDSCTCDMTHSRATWHIMQVWHDSFTCSMTHSCLTWLIISSLKNMWPDSTQESIIVFSYIHLHACKTPLVSCVTFWSNTGCGCKGSGHPWKQHACLLICIVYVIQTAPYVPSKEPCVSTKEPCMSSNEICMPPHISPLCHQKRPTAHEKSPIYLDKRPVCHQMMPTSKSTRYVMTRRLLLIKQPYTTLYAIK